jgi:teichuronic acid biosynthesis glycosyltransferase TuaH
LVRTLDAPAAVEVGRERRNDDWDGLVVLCAANNWDAVKLADRHMAERLTAHSPVLYVDPPMSRLTPLKNPALAESARRPHLRTIGPRLARFTPIVAPKPEHWAMAAVTRRLVRRQLRNAVRDLGARVHAVIATSVALDVYGVCGEERRVYWWQDDPVAGAAYWGGGALPFGSAEKRLARAEERLARAEERLARSSDLIVAVNEGAVARWLERGLPAAHLPNGCDAPYFAAVDDVDAAADVDLPGPIAGFVGHINSRTDLALLEAVADAGVSLLLIGPKDPAFEAARFDRLCGRHNVAYLGPRPFDELPAYLKLIDVGLVPYANTEFNRYSFPMKTLEYLAAGRPVVATALPALHWLETDLVTLADAPDAFAAGVVRETAQSRDRALVCQRREFASRHSWEKRAELLTQLLESPA